MRHKHAEKELGIFHKPEMLLTPLFSTHNVNNLATKTIVNLPTSGKFLPNRSSLLNHPPSFLQKSAEGGGIWKEFPWSLFCLFSCFKKAHNSKAVKNLLGQGSSDLIYVLRYMLFLLSNDGGKLFLFWLWISYFLKEKISLCPFW